MTKEKNTNKNWTKWLLAGLAVLLVLVAFRSYKLKKVQAVRRELMQKQRDIMMQKWQEQGFTEKEIQEKMQDARQQRIDSGERPSQGSGIFQMGRRFHENN